MHSNIYSLTTPAIQKRLRINHFIRIPEVRLIDEQNTQVGVVPTSDALRMAEERGLDLVEVAPQAQPPVCRLLDYGAYQYQQERQERKAKAKQKKSEVKGIRISFKIGEHDLDVRQKQAQKFLEQGHKVKLEMLLRGREKAMKHLAEEKLRNFVSTLGESVTIDQDITRQGGKFFLVVRKK
ncbi:MAG: translation initiation factor IF-3 [Candidatus Nomurabacteria bacterium]|nr:MAG: translation initiation factor IF-3 [Candidatus Nomurabacteria bacterium]